jgi:hypothetical protein
MKSVRLPPSLEADLEQAARAASMSQSSFIRDAVARRCAAVLGDSAATHSLAQRLAPVIGIIDSKGGRAAKTGSAFRAVLAKRRKR